MSKNEIKKKNISANALSDDDLETVAGGRVDGVGGSYTVRVFKPSDEPGGDYEMKEAWFSNRRDALLWQYKMTQKGWRP